MSEVGNLVIYRGSASAPEWPAVGRHEDVQPGDWLTFFIHNAFTGGYVTSVHKGYVLTKLTGSSDPYKVKYDDFYEVIRHTPEPEPDVPEPDVPEPDVPEPEPRPSRKKSKKSKKPPAKMLAFLDGKYKS